MAKRNRPLKLFAFAASAFVLDNPHGHVHGEYRQCAGTITATTPEKAREQVKAHLRERGQFMPPAYGELYVTVSEISAATCAAFAKEPA